MAENKVTHQFHSFKKKHGLYCVCLGSQVQRKGNTGKKGSHPWKTYGVSTLPILVLLDIFIVYQVIYLKTNT